MSKSQPVIEVRIEAEGNQVFQRYITRAAAHGRELAIGELTSLHRGFVTGLDRDWIQLTKSVDAQHVLIRLSNVTSVEETGRTVEQLDPELGRAVVKHSRLFERIATREAEKLG